MATVNQENLALERPQPDESIRVPLTKGLFAVIDAEDADRVLVFKWCASLCKRRRGPDKYCAVRRVDSKTVLLHRFIMDAPPGLDVDHRDGDGLNCRRFNMRLATRGQNNQNKIKVNTAKPYKGVYYNPKRTNNPYYAQIMLNYKTHGLGGFKTAEDAARAYDQKAIELFGEFARLNFPQPGEQGAPC